MIPFDFIYCRPDSPEEAAVIYRQLAEEGKSAVYYGGGSEIITMCRAGSIRPQAVIDLKHIPACQALQADAQALHIGAACTLTRIKHSGLFPLLGLTGGRIADHSNQCRITLGGNLCGSIIYRETSLPLLLAEAEITLYGPQGQRTVPLAQMFPGRMQLKPGEFVLQTHIPVWAVTARYAHIKQTAQEKIDYPLVTVAALWKDGRLRAAFSGICRHPFRSGEIEAVLNDRALSAAARAEQAAALLPEAAYSDREGAGAYRMFVLKNTLCALLEEWEHAAL